MNEEQTHEAIDKDGFFHTGDIGILDEEGFLTITDRKKEMFKTSGGKYIAPQYIENKLKQSRFIEQAMVVGEGEKMPAAFLQVNFAFVREWLKRHGMPASPPSVVASPLSGRQALRERRR